MLFEMISNHLHAWWPRDTVPCYRTCKTLSLNRRFNTKVQMAGNCSYLKEVWEDSSFLKRSQSIRLSVTHCQTDSKRMLFLFGIWTHCWHCSTYYFDKELITSWEIHSWGNPNIFILFLAMNLKEMLTR